MSQNIESMNAQEATSVITEMLQDRRIDVVAKNTGLHQNTLYRIASGTTKQASIGTIQILMNYFTFPKKG